MSTGKSVAIPQLYLDDLEIGVSGTLVLMLCRVWDVNAVTGRYLSRDFVLCDAKGSTIHATARATVAHMFLKLKEGEIYSLKNFAVQPNKEDYRIYKNDAFILELDGDTIVRRSNVSSEGFNRYPFQFVELENLELTDNKYMIDVVGFVTNVGRVVIQRSGSKTLDFYLANSRGFAVRVTMWGVLGDKLIDSRTRCQGSHPIVLTAMSVRLYNNRIYLSSSSSTMLLDDSSIPVLRSLKNSDNDEEENKELLPVDFSQPKAGTLENLLMWSRNRKNDAATFNCEVSIDGIRTKRGWQFPACPGEKCKKQASRNEGHFWCESCQTVVEYPVSRYRLELEVSDKTARAVVVMFDELATQIVKHSAESILSSTAQGEDPDSPFPPALANIIGTTLTLELTAQSYYEHATYDSFTCWRLACREGGDENSGPSHAAPPPEQQDTFQMKSIQLQEIVTPSKPIESKIRKRNELEDSDTECSGIAGDHEATSTTHRPAKTRVQKSYVIQESDLD